MNNDAPSRHELLPLDEWHADMQTVIEDINRLGLEILETHGAAGQKAMEVAKHWKLGERQADEHDMLFRLLDTIHTIIDKLNAAMQQMESDKMRAATETIEKNLPSIEEALLEIRHASLDLLRWTRRTGRIEGSPLPDQYRASYGKLISYAPIFKPRLEAFQHELLERSRRPDAQAAAQQLLSAITRYNGVMDSARSFIQAVIDPPMELVFQETDWFLDDWKHCSVEDRGRMATNLNDCCQFLLYDPSEFDRRTEKIRPQLVDGIDASLYSMANDKIRILFSVDEDPVYEQLTVTLYRVVTAEEFPDACESVFQILYSDFGNPSQDM